MITLSKHHDQVDFSQLDSYMLNRPDPIYPRLTPTGMAISRAFKITLAEFPWLRILKYVIMPDHMHFILSVTKETSEHLGFYINRIKTACTQENSKRNYHSSVSDAPVFADGYNDRILSKTNQLNNWFRYISENPRRLLLKRFYPSYFQHAQIIINDQGPYHIYGNPFLLFHPQLFYVKYKSAFTIEERDTWRKVCIEEIEKESVLVSAFIHPEEKKIMETALSMGKNIIQVVENPFLGRDKPERTRFYLCSEGRCLIISLNREVIKYNCQMTKPRAVLLNNLAKELAESNKEAFRIIH